MPGGCEKMPYAAFFFITIFDRIVTDLDKYSILHESLCLSLYCHVHGRLKYHAIGMGVAIVFTA
jgi:hypothetical protein